MIESIRGVVCDTNLIQVFAVGSLTGVTDVYRDGCITKAPSDALRSVLASQSMSNVVERSTPSTAVDLGSYFTLGVKSDDVLPMSSRVPLSARTPAATPRPSSSRTRVSNQRMSCDRHTCTLVHTH